MLVIIINPLKNPSLPKGSTDNLVYIANYTVGKPECSLIYFVYMKLFLCHFKKYSLFDYMDVIFWGYFNIIKPMYKTK